MPRAYPVVHSKFVNLTIPVKELLAGKTIVKEIAVPGRLVNFVVRD
jgi:leucyl-tRNA synthetase